MSAKIAQVTPRKNLIFFGLVAAMLGLLGAYHYYNYRLAPVVQYDTTLASNIALESRMFYTGDVYWGRATHDAAQNSKFKEAYPFSNLQQFQRDKYDAWIGNLECPAVPWVKQPVGFVPSLRDFNCDIAYLPEAAKWFDIMSLANNHTYDQGKARGFNETRRQVTDHGMQAVGNYDLDNIGDICEVTAMPVRVRLGGKQQVAHFPVAICGYHGVHYTVTDKSIAEISRYAPYMPTVVTTQVGTEYTPSSDPIRKKYYHDMVDQGADVIVGNHPHWVQPTEAYKGKLILYSIGNFMMDQDFSDEVMRGVALDMRMSIETSDINESTLKKWLAIGKTCKAFKDDCLQQIIAQNLNRPKIKFAYEIQSVAANPAPKLPTRLGIFYGRKINDERGFGVYGAR